MNSVAFDLLAKYENQEVSVNAETWDRYRGVRPEMVIPLTTATIPPGPCETQLLHLGRRCASLNCLRLEE